jgi:hypothetical protein
MQSQWVFPLSALQLTPSVVTSSYTVAKELYDRSRGVEFLFRLGSSLGLLALVNCSLSIFFSPVFHSAGPLPPCSQPRPGSIAFS